MRVECGGRAGWEGSSRVVNVAGISRGCAGDDADEQQREAAEPRMRPASAIPRPRCQLCDATICFRAMCPEDDSEHGSNPAQPRGSEHPRGDRHPVGLGNRGGRCGRRGCAEAAAGARLAERGTPGRAGPGTAGPGQVDASQVTT
jgi:hypothetical protein